jgi:2'-phosphotransferase
VDEEEAKYYRKVSKAMTYVLRHGDKKDSLGMTPDGYLPVIDLLMTKPVMKIDANFFNIMRWVEIDVKKRFQIKIDPPEEEPNYDNAYVRAVQGHTLLHIKEELLLTNITFPYKYPVVVHGTYKRFREPIETKGLCKMERNHIHLAKGYIGDPHVISGMRENCEIYIELNKGKMVKDGIKFYESSNGVILTSGIGGFVSPKYFKLLKNNNRRVISCPKYQYLVIVDMKTNYDDFSVDKNSTEMIEFAAVVVDVMNNRIHKAFHLYIKPKDNPKISELFTNRTGITQDHIDGGENLNKALLKFHNFLEKSGVTGTDFILTSFNSKMFKSLK